MRVYQLASTLVGKAWDDALALHRHPITRPIAGQLYHAIGSISANLGEGYGRSSGKDRARIFEYSLSSTRESTAWYKAAVPVLGEAAVEQRLAVLEEIRRLLLTIIPRERRRSIRRADNER